jgi:tetrahydromethanopterin S-methyltransferase subunit E
MDLKYALPVVIALFGIPVGFLGFTNGKIIVAARSQLKKIKAQSNLTLRVNSKDHELQPCGKRNTLQRKMESLRIGKEIKTFKLFMVVIGVFVFCWLPFFAITLTSSIMPITAVYANIKLIFISLGYVNSACNVFIYGFLNKDFKKALLMAVRRKWDSRKRSQSISSASVGRGVNTLERGIENESYVSSTLPR